MRRRRRAREKKKWSFCHHFRFSKTIERRSERPSLLSLARRSKKESSRDGRVPSRPPTAPRRGRGLCEHGTSRRRKRKWRRGERDNNRKQQIAAARSTLKQTTCAPSLSRLFFPFVLMRQALRSQSFLALYRVLQR